MLFCAGLFGFAWGLSNEARVIPMPWWYTPALARFCLILMGWTALFHDDPVQRLFWSLTDSLALSAPFVIGIRYAPVSDIAGLIALWTFIGKVSAAAIFGISITQAVYSLLPGWRTLLPGQKATSS